MHKSIFHNYFLSLFLQFHACVHESRYEIRCFKNKHWKTFCYIKSFRYFKYFLYIQSYFSRQIVDKMPESSVYDCFLQAEKNSFVWDYSLLSTILEISRKTHKLPIIIKEQHTIDRYKDARKQFTSTEEMVLANEFKNNLEKRTLLAPNRFPVTASDCDHFLWWDRDGNDKSVETRLLSSAKSILSQYPMGHRLLIFRNPKLVRSVPTIYHLHVFVKREKDIRESKIDFLYEFEDEEFEEAFKEMYVQYLNVGDQAFHRSKSQIG